MIILPIFVALILVGFSVDKDQDKDCDKDIETLALLVFHLPHTFSDKAL